MWKFIRFIILSNLIVTAIIADARGDFYTPESPLQFSAPLFSESAVTEAIQSKRKLFTRFEIEELRAAIKRNNNTVDNEVAVLKSKMTSLFIDKQELLKLKDLNTLREHIAEKEKAREEIREQIRNDLSNIQYKGLYIIVSDSIDAFRSKELLAKDAETFLAPKAVTDLNGIFIESFSTIRNHVLIEDKIRSVISGEMSVEKQYVSRTFDSRSRFLCLLKVMVSPLKKNPESSDRTYQKAGNHHIIDSYKDHDYKEKLRTLGVPQDEIEALALDINSARNVISTANEIAGKRQNEILGNGNANFKRIDEEIGKLKSDLNNRSTLLKTVIETKTNVVFDNAKLNTSITNALKYFDEKLNQIQDQLLKIKEKELIERYGVSVTIEGKPAEDIARTAVGLVGQISQSYSKVEKFIEETEVRNFMLVSEEIRQKRDIYRVPETIWLYPVAGDLDNFILTVIVRFKITNTPVNTKKPESSPYINKQPVQSPKASIKKDTIKTNDQVQTIPEKRILQPSKCIKKVFLQTIDFNNVLQFVPDQKTINEIDKDLKESIEGVLEDKVNRSIDVVVLTAQELQELPPDCQSGVIRVILDSYSTRPSGNQFIGTATASFYGFSTPRCKEHIFKITVSASGRRHWGDQIPLSNAFETLEDKLAYHLERVDNLKELNPVKKNVSKQDQ